MLSTHSATSRRRPDPQPGRLRRVLLVRFRMHDQDHRKVEYKAMILGRHVHLDTRRQTRRWLWIAASFVLVSACGDDTTASSRSNSLGTVPSPQDPVAPWAVPPVKAPADLGGLPRAWYSNFESGSGCPLLAPTARPADIGASGPPLDPEMGNASDGPFIQWPGEDAPSMVIVLPPLLTSDPELATYYADGVQVVHYQDESEERLPGDGTSLVVLPGVKCAYQFTPSRVHLFTSNFFSSLRIIERP